MERVRTDVFYTHHVVPRRDDEFLLLVMPGSALLVVMLRARNRQTGVSGILKKELA